MKKGNHKLLLLLFFPASFLLLFLARENRGFAEWYALHIYKYISQVRGFLSSFAPFSIAEIFLISMVVFAVVYVIAFVIKLFRERGKRIKNIFNFFINPILLAGTLLFVFTLSAGINYHRVPFSETIGLEKSEYSSVELEQMCLFYLETANGIRESLKEDENGVMILEGGEPEAAERVKSDFNKISEKYETLFPVECKTKGVFFSRALSHMQTSGIMFPFTMEANVNTDIPHFQLPYTMAHELAHIRGYMSEDETNFIAFLACSESEYAEAQYSGYMNAFIFSARELYKTDMEAYKRVVEKMSDKVQRDIEAKNEYWKQFEGKAAEISNKINDAYLKSNNQKNGVKSYGMVVDLLLSHFYTD